jgi:DNA-binding PadR family transcriptional regulator
MKKSKTIYAILGWLSNESLSGYELKKRTEQYIGEFWYGSFGQIYPLLKEMLEEELVTVHEERDKGRPTRKVYTITEKGREKLYCWMLEKPEEDLYRSELLLRLFFGNIVEPEVNRGHLENVLKEAEEKLARLEGLKPILEMHYKNSPNFPYMMINLDRGLIVNQGYVEWCKKTIGVLEELEKSSPK